MKIISWNVNGVRTCWKNGLRDYLLSTDADIIALQETKVNEPAADITLPEYSAFWYCSERGGYSDVGEDKRGGYSGTACFFKMLPEAIMPGLVIRATNGEKWLDKEGRIITLEYPQFYFINIYVPNSQGGLKRKQYRSYWDSAFLKHAESLNYEKPIIIAGDFNIAHQNIDIYPANTRNVENPPGFLPEERDWFNDLLQIELTDTFRTLYPNAAGAYTWWSPRFNGRAANQGCRLDYFLISNNLLPYVEDCVIRADICGSDHAPIEMTVNI